MPEPVITTEQIEIADPLTGARSIEFVAHGPEGHRWLLKRMTPASAQRDGLAYFTRTRALRNGKWELR